MFTFKPKKVFEKINKMDRKQAYTIGAIAVVSVVALLMSISAMTGGEDSSFEGMKARGYDLANMPFATDEAEKFLLANAYPDMRENGSTLLYSAAEKEARQEADEQAAEESAYEGNMEGTEASNDSGYAATDRGGYGGYGGGAGRGGRTPTKTEIGQLGAAGMASAGGTGVSATWGPTGDFRQYKGREDRGNEASAQLNTGNARNALAQFRSGSLAAARIQQNKMANAGKALYGGNVTGSDAFGKDGVDLSKLQNGGLTLDTSAPATTTDLDNLDKKVAEAAKKAEKQQKEEKREWWEDMLIDLAKQAASSLVGAVMDGVGDTLKGAINGKTAQYAARKQANADLYSNVRASKDYATFNTEHPGVLSRDQYEYYKSPNITLSDTYKYTNNKSVSYTNDKGETVTIGAGSLDMGKRLGSNNAAGDAAYSEAWGKAQGTTRSSEWIPKKEDNNSIPEGKVRDSVGNICDADRIKGGKCQ